MSNFLRKPTRASIAHRLGCQRTGEESRGGTRMLDECAGAYRLQRKSAASFLGTAVNPRLSTTAANLRC